MPLFDLIILLLLFFVTSIVGVVTGSNSLITVPVMFQFGIDEKVAVATNMFGLTFMAIGGTIPFMRRGTISLKNSWGLVLLTTAGSALGAVLVGFVTNRGLKLVIVTAMIAVALFSVLYGRKRPTARDQAQPSRMAPIIVAILVFVLAIYGGLYSGGYVTLLTALLAAFTAMPFIEVVGLTKLLNVFSSGIATLIFFASGLVDLQLGIPLAAVMFAGAFTGAHFAAKMNEGILRWIFLSTVVLLAAKTLFDLTGGFA